MVGSWSTTGGPSNLGSDRLHAGTLLAYKRKCPYAVSVASALRGTSRVGTLKPGSCPFRSPDVCPLTPCVSLAPVRARAVPLDNLSLYGKFLWAFLRDEVDLDVLSVGDVTRLPIDLQ